MLTKSLNKAARGLLGWSAKTQAAASGIPDDTLRSFESGRTNRLSDKNESKAISAFHEAGIGLLPALNGQGEGVYFLEHVEH